MKSISFIILLAAITLSGMAQTIGEAFYIYRNDGQFNAFFRDEVQSIEYSYEDAEGKTYDEIVTQVVITTDSVYKIPLAAIDSVGFVTPETKYKNDVTRLEDNLLDYIIGADGLTLKLKPETPNQLVPVKGDKLVLLGGCDALPYGFSGVVSDIHTGSSSIDVVCNQAYLEDLFDSFCSASTVYGATSDEEYATPTVFESGARRVTYRPDDTVFSLGPFKVDRSYEVSQGIAYDGDLALSGGASFAIEVKPTLKIHTILILGEGQGTYFQYRISGDLQVTSQSSLYGNLSYNHDWDGLIASCPIPQTANMVNFYINPGLFIRANATFTSSITSTQTYTFGSAFDYSSKGLNTIKPSVGGRLADSSVDMSGSLDGSIAGGLYLEMGFNLLSRDIAKVCVRGEMGARFGGSFVFRNSDIADASKETKLYERMKASELECGTFVNVSLQASVAHIGNGLTWELSEPIHRWNLVPEFANTKLTQTTGSKTSVDAYTELSGDCLIPVNVGYKLFDENKNEVGNYDAGTSYTNKASKMEHTFEGLEESNLYGYKVYPKVKILGFDVLASPEAGLQLTNCPDENHPHAIDLGLPSGTKWACCNVGAWEPEIYGWHFAWGERSLKDIYSQDTYSYNGINIGSDIAGTNYDVAAMMWGESWRMPTYEEMLELVDNTTSKWTGTGMEFKGRNGASIILPAAGRHYEDVYDVDEGYRGCYWSSTSFYGFCIALYFSRKEKVEITSYEGYRGLSVRPVWKEKDEK